jgi:thioredoxin reductase (NADPH)
MTQAAALGDLETRRAQIFPELSPEQIARVAAFGTERTYADGSVLFDQGDEKTSFFVVLEGELEVVSPRGTLFGRAEELITVHRPRQFTGEVSLLTERHALARGRAKGRLRVLEIDQPALRALIQTDPELSEIVMRAFILRRVALMATGLGDVVVVGSQSSAATLRLQAFLVRNAHPYRFVDVDRDQNVQALLDALHIGVGDIPVLICRGEKVLRNPSDAEVAECLGFNPTIDPTVVYDVVICGAGPGGLAAAVYAASEGLDVLLVEARSPGGQAASSSKIENYLGFPTGISGQALAGRAFAQAEKFGAKLVVAHGAGRIRCEQVSMRIDLEGGSMVRARTVVIATGADYRKLELPNRERFEGAGIYYAATSIEAQRCSSEEVTVVGGGNSAGQAATFLARTSRHVHMLIRGPDLAASMSRYLIRRIEETPNITLRRRTEIVKLDGGDHLEQVRWRSLDTNEETTLPIRHVFSMIGACPNTDWLQGAVALDAHGFIRTGPDLGQDALKEAHWPLARSPFLFETSHPHVFAVGDVRATSVKRVASAVGEGSVCIQLVHKALAE